MYPLLFNLPWQDQGHSFLLVVDACHHAVGRRGKNAEAIKEFTRLLVCPVVINTSEREHGVIFGVDVVGVLFVVESPPFKKTADRKDASPCTDAAFV